MTDHTDLLEQSFEINLNNYGPEDVERLNDWAIKAYDALETLQAEVKHLNLHLKATQSGRDAALARLSKIERQEPVAEMTLVDMGIGDARQLRVNWLMDGYLDVGAKLYAAAGASPVEPNFCESCAMGLSTCDCVTPRPVFVNQLPSAQPSQAQPPAPSEAAREYMTGYSDGREWAGATSQAQPALSGCACRWDADDKRVATCVRHQGWLDVVSEWAERAKAAESQQAQPERAPSDDKLNADRYRWLREQHWSDSKFAVVSNPKAAVNLGSICPSRELLDEAIDAVIKQGGQHD